MALGLCSSGYCVYFCVVPGFCIASSVGEVEKMNDTLYLGLKSFC